MTAEELAKILDELGRRLGPAGAHVYELAVRQVLIDGVVWGAFSLVFLVGSVWIWRRSADWREIDRDLPRAAAAVLFFVALFVLACDVAALLNPEFTAIKNVVEAVKPK